MTVSEATSPCVKPSAPAFSIGVKHKDGGSSSRRRTQSLKLLGGLHRTSTFPRSRGKTTPVSGTASLPISATTATKTAPADSGWGFKRGFSEQFQRISRGTLDKFGQMTRVRKLAG